MKGGHKDTYVETNADRRRLNTYCAVGTLNEAGAKAWYGYQYSFWCPLGADERQITSATGQLGAFLGEENEV